LPRLRFPRPNSALAVAEAFAGDGGDGEAGGEAGGVRVGYGAPLEIVAFVGSVLAEEGVDAVGEVGGDGAERLATVASACEHEASVEVGHGQQQARSGHHNHPRATHPQTITAQHEREATTMNHDEPN
jgi:hypothetical protein